MKYATAGPNDGLYRVVGSGTISNTGNFDIVVLGGSIAITGLNTPTVALPGPACDASFFSGRVHVVKSLIAAGQQVADAFTVDLAIAPGAPDSCVNRLLSYELTFTADGTTP